MCGIFGSIQLNCAENGDSRIVADGVRLLSHRGPDGQGVEMVGPACLGHARLSIIDLTGGKQPMLTEDGRGAISYNGEVYNFLEIKKELQRLGCAFRTNSDTEVVLQAYLQWGNCCLNKFRGMFAFACFDRKQKTVLLARDRVGKKPLFYTKQGEALYFSSELEPLYRTIGPFKMDMEALDDYLSWQYIPAPKTIYQGIISLPPGHFLEINLKDSRWNVKRYWNLEFREDRTLSPTEWALNLDAKLREAVRIRLVSDVPFGAFLSGGIDSSLVVGYMAEIMEMPVQTFSIGFRNADFSELEYAKAVAQICGTEHHSQIVEADSLGVLSLLAWHFGQPFADSSAIPTYYVSRMAREQVKMVLSGDGGDENFAGYNTYENILGRLDGYPSRWASWKERLQVLACSWYHKLQKFAYRSLSMQDLYGLHCSFYCHFSSQERRRLYQEKWGGVVAEQSAGRQALLDLQDAPLVSRLQYLDIMTYLPYDILTKVDIASMANSLEVRTPLLDHELMEAAATMPTELKLKKTVTPGGIRYEKKYILKELAYQRYSGELVDRPKKGFGIPLGEWFDTNLKEEIRRKLLHSNCLPLLFNMPEIDKILHLHTIRMDKSHQLWNLLFLDEWMTQHPDALPDL
jgi:asparagine synthase (glutamine-hydrolysing)